MSNNIFEQEDLTGMYDTNEIQQNKAVTIIGYIPPLFFVPLIISSGSGYAKFHANQACLVTILSFACGLIIPLINFALNWIFIIGMIISIIISLALGFSVIGAIVLGIVNAAEGKAKKLPIIGNIEIFK